MKKIILTAKILLAIAAALIFPVAAFASNITVPLNYSTSTQSLSLFPSIFLKFGIGTSTPYAELSVVGQIVTTYINATSTTATSTLPQLAATDLTLTHALPGAMGGTGLSTVSLGDLLTGNTGNSYLKLADVATGNVLISGGIGVAPSYGKVALTTHVSGTLPIANGGTNATSFTTSGNAVYYNGTSLLTAPTTGAVTTPYASSTAVTITDKLYTPIYRSFTYATSTAWAGTTTIPLGTAFVGERWDAVQCFTDVGTLNVAFNDATNFMNYVLASTTAGTNSLFTNNTIFTTAKKRYVNVGTPASSPTKISCTVNSQAN